MAHLSAKDIAAALTSKANEIASELSEADIEALSSDEAILDMKKRIISYNQMLREKITFINDELTNSIPFTKENLYLIAANSGAGKSSAAANIAYPLWRQGKKILIVSTEEPAEDIYFRIGCLHYGVSFNSYKKGLMPIDGQSRIVSLFSEMKKYVFVVDVRTKDGAVFNADWVQKTMQTIRNSNYSCVMIDYFQLIKHDRAHPSLKTYEVLNNFRIFLMQYIKSCSMPVVLFAQLHSLSKRPGKEIDNRIKECPTIVEAATIIIEVVPNYKSEHSDFIIHKSRFDGTIVGKTFRMGFKEGKYVSYTQDFIDWVNTKRIDNLKKDVAKVEAADREVDDGSL